MNDPLTLRELFRHMEWADAVVWAAVCAHAEAFDDAALRERLHHLHLVQHAFLQVWQGDSSGPQIGGFAESASLLRWAGQYYKDVAAHFDALDSRDLSQPVSVPWTGMFESRLGRKAAVPTLGETMLQVVLHSTYHRGQVNTHLRQFGIEPPLTDFIAWIWMGKPQPLWPNTPGL